MLVSWKWRLVVALVGMALFLSPSGVAAKIERSTDKEGTLHISNTAEVPGKPGGATTPNPPSPPTLAPAPQPGSPPPQPMPPAPRPMPVPPPPQQVAPPPPVEPGETPPVLEPEPNEQQVQPPAEQPEAGNPSAVHQVQAQPAAGSGQPGIPRPPAVQRGRGRAFPAR